MSCQHSRNFTSTTLFPSGHVSIHRQHCTCLNISEYLNFDIFELKIVIEEDCLKIYLCLRQTPKSVKHRSYLVTIGTQGCPTYRVTALALCIGNVNCIISCLIVSLAIKSSTPYSRSVNDGGSFVGEMQHDRMPK